METSEIIRRRREELGLTLMDIAKKVGVSEATIQRYESGRIRNIRQDKIAKLAAVLKLTPAELLGWNEEESPSEPQESADNGKRVYRIVRTPHMDTGTKAADTRLTGAEEIVSLLKMLADLHSNGILTDEEYSDKKRDLLSRL